MSIGVVIIWLAVFVVLIVAFKLYPRKDNIDVKVLVKAVLANEFPEFNVSHLLVKKSVTNSHELHGIALDAKAKTFCLFLPDKQELFDYVEIIECELQVEGVSIAKASKLAQYVGTPVGDVIVEAYDRFGAAKPETPWWHGLMAWTSIFKSKQEDKKPKNVDLRLIVNDDSPFRNIPLIETDEPSAENISTARKEAEMWFEVLKKIVTDPGPKKVDENDLMHAIAGQLEKLFTLKMDGVISEEEYTRVKNNILMNNEPVAS